MKGGYVELDCGGLKISTTIAQAITGIWDRAVNAVKSGKPLCLTNLFVNSLDKPITNAFSKAYWGSPTAIIVMLDKYTITIANTNNVTVSNDITTAVNNANSNVAMTGIRLDLTTAQSLSGIFSKVKTAIEGSKPIVLTGMLYTTGKTLSPVVAYGYMDGSTTATLFFGTYEATISTANAVTIENLLA